jgi:hypothetical protein
VTVHITGIRLRPGDGIAPNMLLLFSLTAGLTVPTTLLGFTDAHTG